MAIEWHTIENLPKDRKDSRDMLLWDDRGAVVASWNNGGWDTGHYDDETGDTLMVDTATHWADINRPGDTIDISRSFDEPSQYQANDIRVMVSKYNIKLK